MALNRNIQQRFLAKVKVLPNGCWEWQGSLKRAGYGNMRYNGKLIGTHRLSIILDGREMPDGMCACHSCDNRACVNPAHLWVGSHQDNMNDAKHKKRFKSGSKNANSKLTTKKVLAIVAQSRKQISRAGRYWGCIEIAKKFGVTKETIRHIMIGKTWSNITGITPN